MPFAYSFQQEPFAFVLLRAVGLVDLVTWANAMQQVIGHRAFRVAMPIVLDVTEAAVPPTRGNEVILAGTWRLLTPYRRGAIVATPGVQFDAAHAVEQLSEAHVRAFTDLPAALEWLRDPSLQTVLSPARRPRGTSAGHKSI